MALTLPFINSISAFDATKGTTINLNVLGGDAITGYQFFIYSSGNDNVPIYSSSNIAVQNDVAGESIRSFPIQLNQTLGLTNNGTYKIQARIYNNTDSIYGNYTDFQCYVQPQIVLQFQDFSGQSLEFIGMDNESLVRASTIQMRTIFNPQDINSPARPNVVKITLYGIQNGQRVYIGDTGNIYSFSYSLVKNEETGKNEINYTANFNLGGFSINVNEVAPDEYEPKTDSLYSSFIVGYECTTIEGMTIDGEFKNINCFYNVLLHSPYLKVQNLCDKGVIQITCDGLTSLIGTSNPPESELVFIDGKELDLTNSEAWVQWQKYFSLQQPYTVRIWARDLQDGVILNMTSTDNSGAYITLKKETRKIWDAESSKFVENLFISLESGFVNSYPYYIETEGLKTSLFDKNTQLFICIQSQNGLFNLTSRVLS